MKPRQTILIIGAVLLASICTVGYAADIAIHKMPQNETLPAFVPDQLVVAFKPGTPGDARRSAHAQVGGRVINTISALNVDVVGIPIGKVLERAAVYRRNPNVRYAEPNYYYTLHVPPSEGLTSGLCSDVIFDEQWSLHNTGQSFQMDMYAYEPCILTGTNNADINWLEVWEQLPDVRGENVKIAIVDTGIDFGHPDLAAKRVESWTANGIIEGAGDIIGHGTHVAGIAAASTNNNTGIAGVGIDAKVGSLKACQCYPDPIFCLTGGCADADIAEAISYATSEGYHVINMSFGGPGAQLIQDAVSEAQAAGIVLVASAGNSYALDTPSYPAAYDGVVSVAATDYYDNLASFSNFGQWVDIAAPGVDIFSTYPGAGCDGYPDCYSWMSGTSMASPIVTGAAALVLSKLGVGATPSTDLRDATITALLDNADHTGALGQDMLVWTQHGRLNLYATLANVSGNTPPVANFTYTCTGLECNFNASGSYDPNGSIVTYAWDFGDGGSGSGVALDHHYGSERTYTVILTVTDNEGAVGSNTQDITTGVTGGDALHVGGLIGDGYFQDKIWWTAYVTVTIHNNNHVGVPDVMVSGTWGGGISGTASGATSEEGQVTFTYPNIHKRIDTVTFSVDGVSGSLPYDPSENHEYEDSGVTSIDVFKP